MMFEFEEYCFIKWKFKFWNSLSENSKYSIFDRLIFEVQHFRLIETLARSIKNGKKIILASLDVSIAVWLIEKSTWSIESNFPQIKNHETGFSVEFSGDYLERLKRFQALLTDLWNILTLHTCLLMKYNPMGINRDLCSLEKITNSTK